MKANGRVLNLGGKCSVPVEPGDMFCLQTPGGGGWGKKASILIASLEIADPDLSRVSLFHFDERDPQLGSGL